MSSSMPEFEMPPERAAAPTSPDRAPGAALDHVLDEPRLPQPEEAPDASRPRRRRLWVALVAVAAIGAASAGGAVWQEAQRAAAAADAEALTDLARTYLDAVQDGRAEEATAMVPVPGVAALLVDDVLTAAVRIQDAEVGGVDVDGDAASVAVSYRTTLGAVERTLAAERTEQGWRLTSSLAEPVLLDTSRSYGLQLSVAGVPIGAEGRPTLLYPGAYRTDAAESPLWQVEPVTLAVDGDPRTPTEVREMGMRTQDAAQEEAQALALAHIEACQRAGTCPVAEGALIGAQTGSLLTMLDVDGSMTQRFGFTALRDGGDSGGELTVEVRGVAAEDGTVSWACSGPFGLDAAGVAGFTACGEQP